MNKINLKNRFASIWFPQLPLEMILSREPLLNSLPLVVSFSDKEEIMSKFPSLGSFTNFRESMPFFDNDKYKSYTLFENNDQKNFHDWIKNMKSSNFIPNCDNKILFVMCMWKRFDNLPLIVK